MKNTTTMALAIMAFAFAATFSASSVEARIKERCIDTACFDACSREGGGSCLAMCMVPCEG
ncbi:MAG TPA: hypothetical protein PLB00_06215 [Pseudomonadota bacterium]|nr:hypothetical protein [Pseudomonadota bacterium]